MEQNENVREKLNYNTLEAKDGVLTIVHQELETPTVFYKDPVKLSGTIQAPGNFVQKRADQHNKLKANVQYSYRDLYIKLRTEEDAHSENNEAHYEVVGQLKVNPDIANISVNSKKKMDAKTLTELIKFNRIHFPDKSHHRKIVENLQTLKVTANKIIEATNNNQGNQKDLYEVVAQTNIDLGFELLMPLFIGQPAKRFKVEVLYNIRERDVDMWLESVELAEILKADAEAIINEELKRLPEEYVFIEQ